MPDQSSITVTDYSDESASMGMNNADLTAGNFTAQAALLEALRATAEDIVRGTINSTALQRIDLGSSTPPSDPEAQQEKRWLITYEDSQQYLDEPTDTVLNPGFGKLGQVMIPCAMPDGQLLPNSDLADLTTTEWVAMVGALEDYQVSEYGGYITVLQARFVGANT